MKTCTKCGESKPISEYHKDKSAKDGLYTQCKLCVNARTAAYREKNPGIRKAYSSVYRTKNRDKCRSACRAWRAANQEKEKSYQADYRSAHRDKAIASLVSWREKYPEKVRIYSQNRRAKKQANGGKLSHGIAAKLFNLQRGKCTCCGKPLGNDFHLDHIVPLSLGGTNTDDNVQLLRATCNMTKSAKHPIDYMQQLGYLL